MVSVEPVSGGGGGLEVSRRGGVLTRAISHSGASGRGRCASGGESHWYLPPLAWFEGAATTYPPAALTSSPGATLTLLPTRESGAIRKCFPPLPVRTTGPVGSHPCSRMSLESDSSPGVPSQSKTQNDSPAARPMLASGFWRHQCRICDGSDDASSTPCATLGCLPGL